MNWIAPNRFRANSGLKFQEYSAPRLGLGGDTDNASVSLRKLLLESCNLHTVLDCPGGIFAAAGLKKPDIWSHGP
jgi:hypothetical protein